MKLPKYSYLETTRDFPSGHATLAWATGLILAQLEPGRATAILARGRSFGDSRIFCGVHNASAVEAGRLAGAAAIAVLRASPQFQRDLQAAGDEVSALRGKQPYAAASCAAEKTAVEMSPYSALAPK